MILRKNMNNIGNIVNFPFCDGQVKLELYNSCIPFADVTALETCCFIDKKETVGYNTYHAEREGRAIENEVTPSDGTGMD